MPKAIWQRLGDALGLENAGLCRSCKNARSIESAKGSVFVLCELNKTDAQFPKYPRLPVISCEGYLRNDLDTGDSESTC